MVERYRRVLAPPGGARVFLPALVARLPQGMSSLAILLLVRSRTGSYVAAGIAVGAFAFATAAGAPFPGRLVDRFGRCRALVPFAVAQAIAFAGLVVAADNGAGPVLLVALSALAGGLLPPIAPTVRALLREILQDPGLR